MKNQASPRSRPRALGIAALALSAVGISFQACKTQPAVEPTQPSALSAPLSCDDWLAAQEPLANLGLQALQAYGRIDPGLFVQDPATGALSVNPAVSATGDTAAFQQALDTVQGQHGAALSRGHGAAVAACSAGCTTEAFTFQVAPRQTVQSQRGGQVAVPAEVKAFEWRVTSATAPSAEDWQRGFEPLYASPPAECQTLPSVAIETPQLGFILTEGLSTQRGGGQRFFGCDCWYGRDGNYDSSGRCTIPC
jgi:hypothetical protein